MLALIEETSLNAATYFPKVERQPNRLRAAVIDDSSTFLEVVCALLERDDEVDVVARGTDGIEALEIVDKLRPDLVLMDIDMPHLDGLNAALVITRCFPRTRVLLMSADDSAELKADCRACGAVGFISKAHFRQEFPLLFDTIIAR